MRANQIAMLVNNVVTSSKEFFELDFTDLPMEVMFLIQYTEGTAVIRYTNNQMPSLTPETKEGWEKQLKIVAQLTNSYTLQGFGTTAKSFSVNGYRDNGLFKGICKLFYNA